MLVKTGCHSVFSAVNQFALQGHKYPWFHVQADTKFVFVAVN